MVMGPGTGPVRPARGSTRGSGPDAVDSRRTPDRGPSATTSRSRPPMRTLRLLVAGLTILAVAACATTTPGWTYAPASPSTAPSADAERIGRGAVGPAASCAGLARGRPHRRRAAVRRAESGRPATVSTWPPRTSPSTRPSSAPRADEAFQIGFDNKDAGCPAQRRDQGRGRREGLQGRHLPGRRIAAYDVPALRGRAATSSSARSTPTWSARSRVQ